MNVFRRPCEGYEDVSMSRASLALAELLSDARKWSFEFDRTNPSKEVNADICNHLELSLISAKGLGASEQQLHDFFDDYLPRWNLKTLERPRVRITTESWRHHLGDRSCEAEYRDFYRAEVARIGWSAAIRHYLPALVCGPAGSAFHALIRLGYGALRQDAVEVAEGLAYWSTVTLEFPHPERGKPFTDRPAEVLKRIREDERFRNMRHSGIGLWTRMEMMADEPDFSPVIDWLSVRQDSIRLIAHDSLALFIETDDLRALHAVTGAQALRELLPFLQQEDRLQAMRYLWQAICSVYGLMGFIEPTPDQRLEELRERSCPEWDEIKAAARASLEEHDLKIVFVMSEEEKAYNDRLYRVASARRMGLL